MTITQKYLDNLVFDPRIVDRKPINRNGSDGYSISCPFCGSNQKVDWKKRRKCAAFLFNSTIKTYIFTCSRCNETMRFEKFIEHFDNALFKQYQWDRFIAGTTGKGHNLRHPQMFLDSEQRLKQLKEKTRIKKWI
tara:strand:- start:387 stop:791 length:405 start_codon:yes stop_codon:yes gene_type:complete